MALKELAGCAENAPGKKKFHPAGTFLPLAGYNPNLYGQRARRIMSDKDERAAMNTGLSSRDSEAKPHADISKKLRALYESIEDEGIPDHLLNLLEKLDQAENAQSNKRASGK